MNSLFQTAPPGLRRFLPLVEMTALIAGNKGYQNSSHLFPPKAATGKAYKPFVAEIAIFKNPVNGNKSYHFLTLRELGENHSPS